MYIIQTACRNFKSMQQITNCVQKFHYDKKDAVCLHHWESPLSFTFCTTSWWNSKPCKDQAKLHVKKHYDLFTQGVSKWMKQPFPMTPDDIDCSWFPISFMKWYPELSSALCLTKVHQWHAKIKICHKWNMFHIKKTGFSMSICRVAAWLEPFLCPWEPSSLSDIKLIDFGWYLLLHLLEGGDIALEGERGLTLWIRNLGWSELPNVSTHKKLSSKVLSYFSRLTSILDDTEGGWA